MTQSIATYTYLVLFSTVHLALMFIVVLQLNDNSSEEEENEKEEKKSRQPIFACFHSFWCKAFLQQKKNRTKFVNFDLTKCDCVLLCFFFFHHKEFNEIECILFFLYKYKLKFGVNEKSNIWVKITHTQRERKSVKEKSKLTRPV